MANSHRMLPYTLKTVVELLTQLATYLTVFGLSIRLYSSSTHYQTSPRSQAKWNQPFRSQTRHVVSNADGLNLPLKPYVDVQSVVQYRTALLNGEAQISSACAPTD